MRYIKPNFSKEWMEALRYPEFEEMGYEGWLNAVQNDIKITNYKKIKDVLFNVNLDFDSLEEDKKKRFEMAFQAGEVEIPIVIKFSDNEYDLLGGNTRLAGLIKNNINPKLWVVDLSNNHDYEMNESEKLKGGLGDKKTLEDIAKKHDSKGYYHNDNMVQSLKKELNMGVKIEMEHTNDKSKAKEIAMDHLWENPSYYSKLKKSDVDEETMTGSSGSFEAPLFGNMKPLKRPINKIHNADLNESEEEIDEMTDSSSSGQFDVPAFGKTTKGGRRDPLKVDGPDSIYKGRAVKDKKFPKWGGPGGVFVKVKEKCKKFPYCNQGNTGALEFIKEDKSIKDAITEASKKYGIPYKEIEKIVINDISKIFI
jgi:hypothetical protein